MTPVTDFDVDEIDTSTSTTDDRYLAVICKSNNREVYRGQLPYSVYKYGVEFPNNSYGLGTDGIIYTNDDTYSLATAICKACKSIKSQGQYSYRTDYPGQEYVSNLFTGWTYADGNNYITELPRLHSMIILW